MKTKEQRYNELYNSGLVDSVKNLFSNRGDISEDYYVLMADYIDSMDAIKDQMLIDPTEIAKRMPEVIKSIQETNLGGIYGRTDDNRIQIEQSLNYEDKKLYFFHELTHALQTYYENGREQCGFYNGHDGMFLTEGATQYIAEILYNISNGTSLEHRIQPGIVRGASDRTPNSSLSEYQYNGDILELMAKSMDLPLLQVLALAYKKDGRETLKGLYEGMKGNEGKFDELMNNMEQIYSIDYLLIHGYGQQLESQTPIAITMQDGVTRFNGNLNIYRELMNKTERELVATYLENHDTEYVLKSYNEIAAFLTTPDLKNNFLAAVQELINLSQDSRSNDAQVLTSPQNSQIEMPEGYSINEFGEIIRPDNSTKSQQMEEQAENKLSFKQRLAQFLQKQDLLINIPFVNNFVHRQLDVLPAPTQEERTNVPDETRNKFLNSLKVSNADLNLPSVQRMSDPQKIEDMRRKMSHDDVERE